MGNKGKGTLCEMKKEGLIKFHPEAFKRLITQPRFFCKKCGRAAVDARRLCKPDTLE